MCIFSISYFAKEINFEWFNYSSYIVQFLNTAIALHFSYRKVLYKSKPRSESRPVIEEYKKLRRQMEDEYILSYYETRLKGLDVRKLLLELESRFGKDIILLCHEDIEEFCHRRILADYIELETGIYIPEVSIDENNKVKKLNPIRYKNRLKRIIEKSE